MKIRNKTKELEVYQWLGDVDGVMAFMEHKGIDLNLVEQTPRIMIQTTSGLRKVALGNYIVKGDDFVDIMDEWQLKSKYDVVEETQTPTEDGSNTTTPENTETPTQTDNGNNDTEGTDNEQGGKNTTSGNGDSENTQEGNGDGEGTENGGN